MKKTIYSLNTLFMFSCLGILLYGCYPDSDQITVEESVLVATQYDEEFNFGETKFYFMPDTVSFVTNVEDPNFDEEDLAEFERTILSTIESIMTLRGYTRRSLAEATPDNTDFTINVAAVGVLNQGASWIPGPGWWWDYYPPGWGWGPGWGWYYPPGWGGYPVYYSYSTGTVMIYLGDADPADVSADQGLVSLRWNAFIDGLLSGVATNENIQLLIQQAFDQSPYIRSNQ